MFAAHITACTACSHATHIDQGRVCTANGLCCKDPIVVKLAPTWGLMQAKSAELGMGLAYRTVQYPQMEDCASSGKAKDLQIGERYHVTYLNAAGREVPAASGPAHVSVVPVPQGF